MNELVDERYILKSGSYLADLAKVDLITWRENEEDGDFWLKLHIGQKEVRFACDRMVMESVLTSWTESQGKEVDMRQYELGEVNGID